MGPWRRTGRRVLPSVWIAGDTLHVECEVIEARRSQSRPGRGTQFVVTLPRHPPEPVGNP